MSIGELLPILAAVLGMPLLCTGLFLWGMKKAGIQPCGSFTKYFYDGCTRDFDTRTGRRQRYFQSKKDGTYSIEAVTTRGTLYLEFYTEDGVLHTWRTGYPAVFPVEIPPGKRVWYRGRMDHFSGSIRFSCCGRRRRHGSSPRDF